MKRLVLSLLALVVLVPMCALALPRRDALNAKEVDELREAALEPEKRLKLYVKYAQERMASIEQFRSDPRLAIGRAAKLHDLIEDLGSIVEEMDNNIDTYAGRKVDLRKPLKDIVESDASLQLKLRAIRESAADPALAEEFRVYKFVLDDAIEIVSMSLDDARELLEEQNQALADKGDKKKK